MQLCTLVSQYTDNKTLSRSKHTSAVTNQKKAEAWANIRDVLNTTGNIPCTIDNVKKEKKKKGLALKRSIIFKVVDYFKELTA